MKFSSLNKTDTMFYKGIAIFMIVIHNFMHKFPSPKEMEFQFYDDRFLIFIDSLSQPFDFIRVMFSYVGHFGVQIFVFLSAYGLTKRYMHEIIDFVKYIYKRIQTIYPSFLLAILLYSIVTSSWEYGLLSPIEEIYLSIDIYIYKILMLSNFIHGQEFSLVGPWWFLSFIFQFYLIFPFLLKIFDKWGRNGLLIISVTTIALNIMVKGKLGDLNLYFTIIGHLPEFCLGIYFAKRDKRSVHFSNLIPLMAILIFMLSNVIEPFWYFSHISFLIFLIYLFNLLNKNIKKDSHFYSFFLYLGSISMPLFLVNGFLREPWLSLAQVYEHWFITIVFCLISFITSIWFALTLSLLEKHLVLFVKKLCSSADPT